MNQQPINIDFDKQTDSKCACGESLVDMKYLTKEIPGLLLGVPMPKVHFAIPAVFRCVKCGKDRFVVRPDNVQPFQVIPYEVLKKKMEMVAS